MPYPELPAPLSDAGAVRCGIAVGRDCNDNPFAVTLHLIPKNLVLGIGCKRGTTAEQIGGAIHGFLAKDHLDFARICAVSTIDIKANEQGLLQFCKQNEIPYKFYSSEELMQTVVDFTSSEFDMQTTGADNICERSAVRCSGGKFIARKFARNGVTVAAAQRSC